MLRLLSIVSAAVVGGLSFSPVLAEEHPLSGEQRRSLESSLDETIAKLSRSIGDAPREVDFYSRRGDAYFFRGRFDDAVADYDKMVELNPRLENSHWRRGIAWFYAGRYGKAAHQFEIYHTFDDVDRENGIWRFLSQAKAHGIEKARQGLLKYKKDDREPFPAVYRLFAGDTTAAEILQQIHTADVDETEREKRLFYAHLYAGLNFAIEDRPEDAASHLRSAVANRWAPQAGFGPRYMWHVGRLHYERLRQKAPPQPPQPPQQDEP